MFTLLAVSCNFLSTHSRFCFFDMLALISRCTSTSSRVVNCIEMGFGEEIFDHVVEKVLVCTCLLLVMVGVGEIRVVSDHTEQLNEERDLILLASKIWHVVRNLLVGQVNTTHPMIVMID